MSGILNNKQRVLDVFITQAGRAQMASGRMQIKYVSFSDAEVFYEPDVVSGTVDVTNRAYFESCNLPQDNVTFEADDSGLLKPFKNSSQYDVINGQMVSWSWVPVTGSVLTGSVLTNYVQGTAFASLSDGLLTSSIDNFKNLRILSTYDMIFDDAALFTLSSNEVTWNITNDAPIDLSVSAPTVDVNVLDSLFDDPHCGHMINFSKLPPINDKKNRGAHVHAVWAKGLRTLQKSVRANLADYRRRGYGKVIDVIDPRPRRNNFVCQMFEQCDNKLTKLDVIDYGVSQTPDNRHPTEHVFFIGKIFEDSYGSHTFVHMFTLVFD